MCASHKQIPHKCSLLWRSTVWQQPEQHMTWLHCFHLTKPTPPWQQAATVETPQALLWQLFRRQQCQSETLDNKAGILELMSYKIGKKELRNKRGNKKSLEARVKWIAGRETLLMQQGPHSLSPSFSFVPFDLSIRLLFCGEQAPTLSRCLVSAL